MSRAAQKPAPNKAPEGHQPPPPSTDALRQAPPMPAEASDPRVTIGILGAALDANLQVIRRYQAFEKIMASTDPELAPGRLWLDEPGSPKIHVQVRLPDEIREKHSPNDVLLVEEALANIIVENWALLAQTAGHTLRQRVELLVHTMTAGKV